MFGSGGSVSDPFRLNDLRGTISTTNNGYNAPAGRTVVNPTSLTGRIKVLVLLGQSNIVNSGQGGTHTLVNTTKVHNLNIWDGGLYRAADPLLGGDGIYSCMGTKLGDTLVTDNYADHVVLVPVAIGATTVAQWAAGGICNHRIGVAFRRIAAVGLTPTHVLWQQGESDQPSTTQNAYTTSLNSVISTIQGFTNAKIFVSKTSWLGGSVSAAVQAAQTASWNGTTVIQGPNTDSLDSSNRTANTDFTFNGMTAVAALWAPIIEAN